MCVWLYDRVTQEHKLLTSYGPYTDTRGRLGRAGSERVIVVAAIRVDIDVQATVVRMSAACCMLFLTVGCPKQGPRRALVIAAVRAAYTHMMPPNSRRRGGARGVHAHEATELSSSPSRARCPALPIEDADPIMPRPLGGVAGARAGRG